MNLLCTLTIWAHLVKASHQPQWNEWKNSKTCDTSHAVQFSVGRQHYYLCLKNFSHFSISLQKRKNKSWWKSLFEYLIERSWLRRHCKTELDWTQLFLVLLKRFLCTYVNGCKTWYFQSEWQYNVICCHLNSQTKKKQHLLVMQLSQMFRVMGCCRLHVHSRVTLTCVH